jgi:hypothetical protein
MDGILRDDRCPHAVEPDLYTRKYRGTRQLGYLKVSARSATETEVYPEPATVTVLINESANALVWALTTLLPLTMTNGEVIRRTR